MGIDDRIRRVEGRMHPAFSNCLYSDDDQMETYIEELARRGWSVDEQLDRVIAHWRVHCRGDTVQIATDRELALLDVLIDHSKELPESARERFERMEPREQPAREARLFALAADRRERA